MEALLADGRVVTVRPVTGTDLAGLLELNQQASEQSLRMRFFASGTRLGEQYARHLAAADDGQLAVVAERNGEILGVASAERAEPAKSAPVPEAEVALLVSDRRQHTGVGTLLLEHLAATARAAGIQRFTATVLAENSAMFDVFVHAGFDVQFHLPEAGQLSVALDLRGSQSLAAAIAERERRASAASIAPLLNPGSVIVVGAGRRPGSLGRRVLDNLRAGNFTGRLAAVNRQAVDGELISGVPAYSSVPEVPWRPDLAVIAVPAAEVAAVLDRCGAAGARGAVVLSAGFAEAGNPQPQAELVQIAHRHGIRLLGPNCLGVLNTDPAIRLDATDAGTSPPAGEFGGIGLGAQSGALGIAVLDAAQRRGLGVSSFVSLGNKADVSGNDLLLYWAGDPRTQVIALGLESIGNARRFRRIAASIARTKPIVVLSGGRSDAATRALFRDAGVLAVNTTEELVDVAALLAHQPVPAGRRVVIIGNGGQLGALAAEAAVAAGAQLPRLSAGTVAGLRAVVDTAPALENPVDLGVAASPGAYLEALNVVLASEEADSLVVLHVATGAQSAPSVIAAVELAEREAALEPGRRSVTVAAALIGATPPRAGRMPWYGSAEAAAHAVARSGELGSWRAQSPAPLLGPAQTVIPEDIDTAAVSELIGSAACSVEGWMAASATTRLLQLIGVRVGAIAPTGLELLVGLAAPGDGIPTVMVAAGGIHAALRSDRELGTLPLAPGVAARMVDRLRCAPLLDGHRGTPVLDRAAAVEALQRIALLDSIAPQIRELEINPLVVGERGVTALGARIRLAVTGEPVRRRDPVNDDYERELG
jgi:acyl-CoA synthetase (NDP forming)/GNAT superfamily N-acetyltransferase